MEPLRIQSLAVDVVTTGSADPDELAAVAARTFPLACPPSAAPENIASFIDANLSAARFAEYLTDPRRAVLAARQDGRIVGYAMLVRGVADDSAELSKMYVLPDYHGAGVSAALMDLTLATAEEWGVRRVWLGVNQKNQRAQRFYTKSGFKVNGTRTFQVGASRENDYVMVRERSAPTAVKWPAGTSFDTHWPASPH
ncbi:GNAT family N-acetyltransferase [Mycobacterium malmoense]|nr:GNAT family N-acetyltransferase [Mycobacterium malmoense]UNB96012.1 GNAT family N-acetyltransferase [Mycobacterium malmoense]